MKAALNDSTCTQSLQAYRNQPTLSTFRESVTVPPADVIYLVDDDSDLQAELLVCLQSLQATLIPTSAAKPSVFSDKASAACIIMRGSLEAFRGIDAESQLAAESLPPVIVVGELHDVPSAVAAMKAGAIDFFVKPIDLWALRSAIEAAFAQDRKRRKRAAEMSKLRERLRLLTPREKEVLPLVIGGLLNKQAASLLGISEVTLQIHRSQIMRKMQASSLAELVRMAVKLRIPHHRCE